MNKIDLKKLEKNLTLFVAFLAAGYIVAIIFINLFGKMFSDFDIYSDSLVAQQMWEQKTLFPQDWFFGNQFYIAATPVLSAVIYGIVGNRALALGVASSLMLFFTIFAFVKCFAKSTNKIGLFCGILCLCGGAIVSTGAATELNGLQLIFTMASFYSCYLIGIFVAVDVYTRLIKKERCNIISVIFALLFNFALGMNSLRQTLILCIPLFSVELLLLIKETIESKKILQVFRKNCKRIAFAWMLFVCNLVGAITIKLINPLSNPVAGKFDVPSTISEFVLFFKSSVDAFLNYIGLKYFTLSVAFWPLGLISIFLIGCVITAVIMMIRKKDTSPIAIAAYINIISVTGVFVTGVFVMRTRDVYYFTWYILVTCCVMYLCNEFKNKLKIIFVSALVCVCFVNAFFSFQTNPFTFIANHKEYSQIAQTIEQSGYECVHILVGSPASPAAYTEETLYTMLQINDEESGYPLKFLNCTQSKNIQKYAYSEKSLLLISSVCRQQLSDEFFAELEPKLELKYSFSLTNGQTLNYYAMSEKIIADFE